MELTDFSQHYVFRRVTLRDTHYNDARQGNRCHYIGYLRRGRARIVGEGKEILLSEGELFYIPKDFPYESFWEGDPDIEFDSYGFSYFPHPVSFPYPLQRVETDGAVTEALEQLAAHRVDDCLGIARLYLLLNAMLPHMRTEAAGHAQRTVETAMAYMREQRKLSVPAMARHCGVSESGLYAAFRKVAGKTPVEAWHRICVKRAAELLDCTDLSVEEIAFRLEFCSASYFRRVFGRIMGVSPRAWRTRPNSKFDLQ